MTEEEVKSSVKRFHKAKGVRYIVLDVDDVVDCMGVDDLEVFQHILGLYADRRRATGRPENDLEWAIRAMSHPGDLTYEDGREPTPQFVDHMRTLIARDMSPQPTPEDPNPAAVARDALEVTKLVDSLALSAKTGLRVLRTFFAG
jgi:hypothetical protein